MYRHEMASNSCSVRLSGCLTSLRNASHGVQRASCSPRACARALHTTRPALKGLFGGLFRKRRELPFGADGTPRLSLLDQSSIPEDLRLPKPADPVHRIAAGALDGILSVIGGSVAGAAAYYATGGAIDLAVSAAQGSALVLWVLRDALGDEGNRSIGKRAFKLEIVEKDGTLAQPGACMARNAYFLLIPAAAMHPYISLSLEVLLFWDVATLFLTPDARKVGDYALGTRVVDERPGREGRVLDMLESTEIRELRGKIEAAAPGLLAARERADPGTAWYENTQAMLASLSGLPGAKAAKKAADARRKEDAQKPTLYDSAPLASMSALASPPPTGTPSGGLPPPGMGGLFGEIRGMEEAGAGPGAGAAAGGKSGDVAPPAAEAAKASPAGAVQTGGRVLYVNKPGGGGKK